MLFAEILLWNVANWKMNSFSIDPPTTQLWFRLIELNVLALSPHALGGASGLAPYGWEFWLRP